MSVAYSETDFARIGSYVEQFQPEPPELREIREASETHRAQHGPDCSVYPSSPGTGRLLQALIRLLRARRVLELGCGLGYSAAWMAHALPPSGRVETVENVPEHANHAAANFRRLHLERRIQIRLGAVEDVVPRLRGAYDLIFDDCTHAATHGSPPPYLADLARLLRPGGLILFANIFPVEDYILGRDSWSPQVREGTHRWIAAVFERRDWFPVLVPLVWRLLAVKVPAPRTRARRR